MVWLCCVVLCCVVLCCVVLCCVVLCCVVLCCVGLGWVGLGWVGLGWLCGKYQASLYLSGYQRELTYQHADGSYSAFGNKYGIPRPGSLW